MATLPAALLPGGRWADTLALLALVAGLHAAAKRRPQAMAVAAGLAVGLSPAGLLLLPLAIGAAIRQRDGVAILLGVVTAVVALMLHRWTMPPAALPNAALLAAAYPWTTGPLIATGIGVAALLTARATVVMPAALYAEARLGMVALTCVLPLPIGCAAFLLVLLSLPLPAPQFRRPANDNRQRPLRLVA